MSDEKAPKKKIVRCGNKKCNRFLCEIAVPLERPPIGEVTEIRKLTCNKCGYENSFKVTIEDRSDDQSKAAN